MPLSTAVKPVLPIEEFLHPLPLTALAILSINDHWLKGSGLLPGALTGKLSDVAGLFFFPLLMTAIGRCLGSLVLWRRVGLRAWMLLVAIALTTTLFTLLKIAPAFVAWFELAAPRLDPTGLVRPFEVTLDRTDLLTLPIMGLTWWHGRRFFEPGRAERARSRAQKPTAT